jgi:hypothetical protein
VVITPKFLIYIETEQKHIQVKFVLLSYIHRTAVLLRYQEYLWHFVRMHHFKFKHRVSVLVFNATFTNILVISWRSVLLLEETGENPRPAAKYCQTWSHNVVSRSRRNSYFKFLCKFQFSKTSVPTEIQPTVTL